MKRYLVLIACVLMQMCLGPIYAWSTFVPKLQASYGYASWRTQLVFGTSFLVFSVAGVFAGRILDRYGPRILSVIAGLLLGSGYLLASFCGDCFWLLWLGIGCLGGLGIACGYYCPVATAVKWFPKHKGLVGGLAIGGYGASAIILTNIARVLFNHGWAVLDIFRFVALVYGPIIMVMGLLLFTPPGSHDGQAVAFRRRLLLGDRQFWAMLIAMFCGTLPGLVVNGNLRPIGQFFGFSEMVALQAITMFAIGSASGRVLGGFAYDLLGGRRSLMLALGMITLSIIVLIAVGLAGHGWLWLPAALFVGFCYGGGFGVYPGQIVDLYGYRVLGTVYALVMLGHGVAGLSGPPLAGWTKDLTGSFLPGLVSIAAIALAGLFVFSWLSRRQFATEEKHARPVSPLITERP